MRRMFAKGLVGCVTKAANADRFDTQEQEMKTHQHGIDCRWGFAVLKKPGSCAQKKTSDGVYGGKK